MRRLERSSDPVTTFARKDRFLVAFLAAPFRFAMLDSARSAAFFHHARTNNAAMSIVAARFLSYAASIRHAKASSLRTISD